MIYFKKRIIITPTQAIIMLFLLLLVVLGLKISITENCIILLVVRCKCNNNNVIFAVLSRKNCTVITSICIAYSSDMVCCKIDFSSLYYFSAVQYICTDVCHCICSLAL